MRLRRVFQDANTPALKHAVEIANSLPDFASEEELEEILNKIPDSDEYFVFVTSSEWGYEIIILHPK